MKDNDFHSNTKALPRFPSLDLYPQQLVNTSPSKHATTPPILRDCSSELGVAQDFVLMGLCNRSFQEHEQLWKCGALLMETLFWRAIPNPLTISQLFFLCAYLRLFEQNPLQLISFSSSPPLLCHLSVRETLAEHRNHFTSWHRAGNFPKQTHQGAR